ncbi:3'-5' exonuclease [Agromyces sp. MMS17-SY077]|uniref:3'-5' exonuclease n=2 Tax=Agromyces seonyuensis TaxID=2662446 RepID=A0A6I4NVS3_9MICO|nr:3'-5' exonuclease [Agromyces seonyuensis]
MLFDFTETTDSWATKLAVFDLETTGVDVETARVVTAFLGVLDADGEIVERHEWLIDPGVEIPAGAAAVHGISTERARAEGLPAHVGVAEIVDRLAALLAAGLPIVAYNAAYDFSVIDREAIRYAIPPLETPGPIIDPFVLDKAVERYRRGKRTLTATTEHYGVPLESAHDAGADAVAAGRLAQAIGNRYPQLLEVEADELHRRQIDWAREQAESYQQFRRRTEPSFTTSGTWPVR